MTLCERCEGPISIKPGRAIVQANEYGEFICEDCEQNAAEAAYDRYCEDFHDGGSTRFKSLAERQADARRLK